MTLSARRRRDRTQAEIPKDRRNPGTRASQTHALALWREIPARQGALGPGSLRLSTGLPVRLEACSAATSSSWVYDLEGGMFSVRVVTERDAPV